MKDHAVIHQPAVPINELSREKTRTLEPGQEDAIPFPQVEVEQRIVVNPSQNAFTRIDQLADELPHDEDESVPVLIVGELREGQNAFEHGIGGHQAGLFMNLTDGAGLWRFARFQLAAQSVPLALVHVVLFFDPVDHKGLVGAFEVTESGEFHKAGNQLSVNGNQFSRNIEPGYIVTALNRKIFRVTTGTRGSIETGAIFCFTYAISGPINLLKHVLTSASCL